MPDVRMPNGLVIRGVPEGTTKAQLQEKLVKNGYKLDDLMDEPGPSWGQTAAMAAVTPFMGPGVFFPGMMQDLGLRTEAGALDVGKTLTDVFGAGNAASNFLGETASGLRGATSPESRAAEAERSRIFQESQDEGILGQLGAAGEAFATAPLDVTAQVVGSAAPFVAASIATGGGAVGVGAAAGLGAVSGAGTIKGDIYDTVRQEYITQGVPEEKANAIAQAAQSYGGENLDSIALGTILGAAAAATGVSRNIANIAVRNLVGREAAQAAERGLARRFVAGALEEAVPEAIQEGQESVAQNVALQREGKDVPTFQGAVGQGAFAGLSSLMLGGLGGAADTGHAPAPGAPAPGVGPETTIDRELPADMLDAIPVEDRAQVEEHARQYLGLGLSPKEALQSAIFQVAEAKRTATPEAAPVIPGAVEPAPAAEKPPLPEIMQPEEPAAPAQPQVVPPPVAGEQFTFAPDATWTPKPKKGKPVEALPVQLAGEPVQMPGGLMQPVFGPTGKLGHVPVGEVERQQNVVPPTPSASGVNPGEASTEPIAPAPADEAVVAEVAPVAKGKKKTPVLAEPGPVGVGTSEVSNVEAPILEAPVDIVNEENAVPVKKLAPGNARGLTPSRSSPQSAVRGRPVEGAQALTRGMQAQQDLTHQLEVTRKDLKIDDSEKAEITHMLSPPMRQDDKNNWVVDNKAVAKDQLWNMALSLHRGVEQAQEAVTAIPKDNEAQKAEREQALNVLRVRQKALDVAQEEIVKRARLALDDKVRARLEEQAAIKQQIKDFPNFAKEAVASGQITQAQADSALRDLQIERNEKRVYKWLARRNRVIGPTPKLASVQEAAQKIVDEWKGKNKPALNVVQSYDDLPADIRAYADNEVAPHELQGVHDNGTIHVVADNVDSLDQVKGIMFHEGLGHSGLRSLFDHDLRAEMRKLYDGNKDLKVEADKWMEEHPGEYADEADPQSWAAEEALSVRSENGKVDTSILQKLAALIRRYARRAGFNVAISNNDVMDILRRAHEQVGGKGAEGRPAFSTKKTNTGDAEAKKIAKAKKQATKGLRAIKASAGRDPKAAVLGLEQTVKAKDPATYVSALEQNWRYLKGFKLKAILKALPADGLLQWAGKDLPNLQRINEKVDGLMAMRRNLTLGMSRTVEKLGKFVSKNGQTLMGDAMHLARVNRVSTDQFKGKDKLDDVYLDDPIIQHYETLLLDPQLDPKLKKRFEGRIKFRQGQIEQVWDYWKELGKKTDGQKTYLAVREMHKAAFLTRRRMLEEYVQNLGATDDAKARLLEAIQLEQEDVNAVPSKKDAHPDFPEVPLALFPKEYFPFKRYGDYYLRVSPKGGEKITQFFATDAERNKARREFASEFGVDPEDPKIFATGDVAELRKEFASDTGMMRKVFGLVDALAPKDQSKGLSKEELEDLKDEIFQTYILARPEGAFRNQFVHAKNRWGFDADVMHNTKTLAGEYANHISKLRYKHQVETEIEEAYAALEGRPVTEQQNLKYFVQEFADRARSQLNPPPSTPFAKFVSMLNRFTFVMLLTSGATAATQFSGIPVRVMPRLWTDYGHIDASAKWAKYLNVWKSVGTTHKTKDGSLHWVAPSVGQSSIVKSNPLLRRAFEAGYYDHALFMTAASEIMQGGQTPSSISARTFGRGKAAAYRMMTAMFNASEQISREATYMMAFELEYKKNKGDFDGAVKQAVRVLNDTLGNYSDFNRPTFMRSAPGRAVFLFKQYAVNTTRFFVGNFLATVMPFNGLTVKERAKAAQELSYVLLMGGLFHGIAGMPLYSLVSTVVDLMLKATDDDEDRRKRAAKNPYTVDDSKYRFENDFMPENFGDIWMPGADGRQHSLANVLTHGPVSELSDVNMGSRTTFDGLWFRAPQGTNENAAEWLQDAIVSNIPGASVNTRIVQGLEDLHKGNIDRGLEAVLPAMFRGGATAHRLSTEGAETRGGEQVMNPEEFSDANMVAQMIGFQPTTLAQYQSQRTAIKRMKTYKSGQRSELTREFNEAFMDGASRDELLVIVDKMAEYNSTITDPTLRISYADLRKSLSAYAGRRKFNLRGYDLDEDDFQYFANDILDSGRK